MCYRLLDCCLGVGKAFSKCHNHRSIEEEKWKCHWLTSCLTDLLQEKKKKKKLKIHLGGEEKERTKERAGEMMMMLSFALCTADHITLRRGHFS